MCRLPIEPGWYLARVEDVGDVAEWGPMLADCTLSELLFAVRAAILLDERDEAALLELAGCCSRVVGGVAEWSRRAVRCEGLLEVRPLGVTSRVALTQAGRRTLAVAAALRGVPRG